jgi:predicted DNA binding protein
MNDIFKSLTEKEIILPEHFEDYKDGMGFFYGELITLNTNIFIINKIRKFPFDLFCTPDNRIFFSMVINNFFEYSIIIISRLFKDTGRDCFTLPKFKNKIISLYIRPEYKSNFIERIKEVNFKKLTADILNRIHDLRKKRIAHNLEEFIKDTKNIGRINFDELEKLRDCSNKLFDNLSFRIEHIMVPIPYSDKVIHPKDTDPRSDIEKILDSIAKESYFLNMPELDKYWLEYGKKRITERELKILNEYREKFGYLKV